MSENDSQEELELQNPSCSSSAEVSESENRDDSVVEFDLFEAIYKSVLEELIDDIKWEYCFEIHRSAKMGYFCIEDPEKRKHQIIEDAEKDIFGQKLKSKVQTFQISCPMCKNKSCATKFASHLAKCIGISGRNSSRAATRKISQAHSEIYGCDIGENGFDSDSSYSSNKRSKRSQTRRSPRRKASMQGGNSVPKPPETCASAYSSYSGYSANYQEMTFENRKAFLAQKCGVISKRTSKMCMNPYKCVQHTDEQKRDVRHFLLRDMGDQITNDAHIDIDTVDEGNDGFSFIAQSFSAGSTPSKAASPGAGEKKQANCKGHTVNLKKKKSVDSNSSVSSPVEVASPGSSFEN